MSEGSFTDAEARRGLAKDLKLLNFAVHQPDDPILFTEYPEPEMQPWHWRAADIRSCLDRIASSIKLEAGGVRRTLRLANPGLPFGTTPSLWASIQYILPGEIATAHRHTATALRFIMEGEGADTIVDGEQYMFNEGDLVLTPAWAFHDHMHNGDAPMIWLDVLDTSLVRKLDAVFFEASDTPRRGLNQFRDASYREFGSGIMRPTKSRYSQFNNPLMVYARDRAEEAMMQASGLDPDPFVDTEMEYRNPVTGGPALTTIGTSLMRLRPGISLRRHRRTGSSIYYVIRGNGRTVVNQETFDWGSGDFFAIPSWASHAHSNASAEEDALLFHVNDFPALQALGLWQEAEG